VAEGEGVDQCILAEKQPGVQRTVEVKGNGTVGAGAD